MAGAVQFDRGKTTEPAYENAADNVYKDLQTDTNRHGNIIHSSYATRRDTTAPRPHWDFAPSPLPGSRRAYHVTATLAEVYSWAMCGERSEMWSALQGRGPEEE